MADGGSGRTSKWIEERLPVWQETAEQVAAIERGRSAPAECVTKLIHAYPEMARDLAVVRREAPDSPLTRRLEQVYVELHRSLFKRPGNAARELVAIFVRDAADVAHSLRWHIVWITALFFASATAGAWLINQYPEVVKTGPTSRCTVCIYFRQIGWRM